MKNLLLSTILLISHIAFSQVDTTKLNTLISNSKYESAFKYLDSLDSKNENPEVVIFKVDMAINYFVKSLMHQMFAFYDLQEGDDLMELRMSGENKPFTMYMFPADSIIYDLLKTHPEEYELHKALGEYYYDVLMRYSGNADQIDHPRPI